jgi:hypothetical protein
MSSGGRKPMRETTAHITPDKLALHVALMTIKRPDADSVANIS